MKWKTKTLSNALNKALNQNDKEIDIKNVSLATDSGACDEKQEPPMFRIGPIERVVSGDCPRDPVNREAAKLLSKSSWIHHPPIENKTTLKKGKKMSIDLECIRHKNSINPDAQEDMLVHGMKAIMVNGQPMYRAEDVSIRAAQYIIEDIKKQKDVKDLLDQLNELHKPLRQKFDEIKAMMTETSQELKAGIEDLRQTRFASIKEFTDILTPLKDIRQFFAGIKHEEEIKKLSEFVELCERLKMLKDSGFLDRITETMLSMA